MVIRRAFVRTVLHSRGVDARPSTRLRLGRGPASVMPGGPIGAAWSSEHGSNLTRTHAPGVVGLLPIWTSAGKRIMVRLVASEVGPIPPCGLVWLPIWTSAGKRIVCSVDASEVGPIPPCGFGAARYTLLRATVTRCRIQHARAW